MYWGYLITRDLLVKSRKATSITLAIVPWEDQILKQPHYEFGQLTEYHFTTRLLCLSEATQVSVHFTRSLNKGTSKRVENGPVCIMGRVIKH